MKEHLAEWFEECVVAYRYRVPVRWKQGHKRRAIEMILRADPHRSDRAVSRQTGFSRELISKIRQTLPSPQHRVGLDGKTYRRVVAGPISRPINASTKSEIQP